MENCKQNGYTWWTPAITQQQCESVKACYDVYLPTLEYGFSPKNEQNCTSSENLGVFKSIFNWKPATWYSGIQRPLKWIDREVPRFC
jgi:hypothetical protein